VKIFKHSLTGNGQHPSAEIPAIHSTVKGATLTENGLREPLVKGKREWANGFVFNHDRVKHGGTVGVSFDLFIPEDGDYSVTGSGSELKFIRFATHKPNGSSAAYADTYLGRDGFRMIRENEWKWTDIDTPPIVKGEWHTYTCVADTNIHGHMTMYMDNVYIGTALMPVLLNEDHYCEQTYIGTYWNGGVPKDQVWYRANFAHLTSDKFIMHDEVKDLLECSQPPAETNPKPSPVNPLEDRVAELEKNQVEIVKSMESMQKQIVALRNKNRDVAEILEKG
jgi:hypothetical protein